MSSSQNRANALNRIDRKWLLLFLAIASFLVFSPCLQNSFVNLDDPDYITENPAIRSLSFENLKKIFSTTTLTSYCPLTILSFALEYHFFGLSSTAIHLDNVLLHVLNGLLVFSLIRYLTRNDTLAFGTALLFTLHPLRVESVAWAVERKDVLHAAFYLGGLICYLRSRQDNDRRKPIITAYVLFVLACLSKPQAISFPLALLTLDYFLTGKLSWQQLWTKVLFFLTAGIFFWITFSSVEPSNDIGHYSILDKCLLSGYSFTMYLLKIIFPTSLSALYPAPQKIGSIFFWPVYLNALLAVTFLAGTWKLLLSNRFWAWGLLFFVTLISLPLAHIWTTGVPLSDRFSYLASIGIAYTLTKAALALYNKFSAANVQRIALCTFAVYILFLGISTFERCGVWKDSLRLWNDVIGQHPNIPVAYNNRGNTYNRLEKLDLALSDYTKAIELDPHYSVAHNNLGVVYYKEGMCKEAITSYNKAIALDPENLEAYNNRAACYAQTGLYAQALEDINYVIRKNPNKMSAYHNRTLIQKRLKTN